MILQKLGKRMFGNVEEVRGAISLRYPEATVLVVSWETQQGGLRAEASLLCSGNISILLSMSGTGINTAMFLPRGSVVINTGAPINYLPGHVGDNFIHALDHVKVLHYQDMRPEDADGPGQDATVRLPPATILPWVDRAVSLFRSGFSTPVRYPDNHSPQGKLTSCILHRFPEASWWASLWQGTKGDASNALNANPAEWFAAAANNVNSPSGHGILAKDYPRNGYSVGEEEFSAVAAACATWAGAAAALARLPPASLANATQEAPPWISKRVGDLDAIRSAWEAKTRAEELTRSSASSGKPASAAAAAAAGAPAAGSCVQE